MYIYILREGEEMRKKNLIRKSVAIALAMATIFTGTTVSADTRDWDLKKSASLSHSQGTSKLYMDGDRYIQARINVVNSNNYKTSDGKNKYLWAAICYKASGSKYSESGTKSSGMLLASKYDNKGLVSYGISTKVYSDNGMFRAKTYTSNDVRYKGACDTYSIIGSNLIYYKK